MTNSLNEVGGSALEAKPASELAQTRRNYQDELQSTDNFLEEPKYPLPDNYYYAKGALSIDPRGAFLFSDSRTKPGPGLLRGDLEKDDLRSTLTQTTLGSVHINTVAGDLMNPVGPYIPSSHMTPQRTWIRDVTSSFWAGGILAVMLVIRKSLQESGLRPQENQSSPESENRKPNDHRVSALVNLHRDRFLP